MKNLKKNIIIFSLSTTYFLVLSLLGEYFFQFALIGIGTIFLLLFNLKKGNWNNLDNYPKINLLLILFYFSLIFSSFFTQSIPLTLSKLNFYSLSIGLFITTLVYSKKINHEWLFLTVVSVTWNLVAISTFFKFFPDLASFLPNRNMLYATYGHNHIASLLLLVIPISWWMSINQKSKIREIVPTKFINFLPIFFSLSLLFSFGRVAVFIGLIQLLFLRNYIKKQKILVSKKVLKTQRLIEVLFILILLIKLVFSTLNLIKTDVECPTESFKNKICKPITSEPRPYYWLQALNTIKDFPITGFGPGTFGIASKKYAQKPLLFTSYAHNHFLETYSDIGVFGGTIFLMLMISIVLKAIKQKQILLSKNKKVSQKNSWQTWIKISVSSSYLNSLFDFDWDYIVIFSLTLVFSAILIRNNKSKHSSKNKLKNLTKFLFIIFSSYSIIIGLIYGINEWKIHQNRIVDSFDFFPYFNWHKEIYKKELPKNYYEKLLNIYKNEAGVYSFLIKKESDQKKLAGLKKSLFSLNKWERSKTNNLDYFIKIEDFDSAREEINQIEDLRRIAKENNINWLFKNYYPMEIANSYLKTADLLLLKDPSYAAELYKQAQELDGWAWAYHKSILFSSDKHEGKKEKLIFLRNFPNEKSEYWGKNVDEYSKYYLYLVLDEKNEEELQRDITRIVSTTGWLSWESWSELSKYYQSKIEGTRETSETDKLTSNWFEIWKTLKKLGHNLDYQFELSLAKNLVSNGNQLVVDYPNETVKKYEQARELVANILDEEKLWFEIPKIKERTQPNNLRIFLDEYSKSKSNNLFGKKENSYWLLWQQLFNKYLEKEEFDSAEEIVEFLEPIKHWNYENRLKLTNKIQREANSHLIEKHDEQKAIKLIKLMTKITPEDYWSVSQPGYLFLYLGNKFEAKEAFRNCLETYSYESHYDCQFALENIDQINTKKYLDVSKTILNY